MDVEGCWFRVEHHDEEFAGRNAPVANNCVYASDKCTSSVLISNRVYLSQNIPSKSPST